MPEFRYAEPFPHAGHDETRYRLLGREHVTTAIEEKVSIASIERAVKAHVEETGGKVAPMMRTILKDLGQAGAMLSEETVTRGVYTLTATTDEVDS